MLFYTTDFYLKKNNEEICIYTVTHNYVIIFSGVLFFCLILKLSEATCFEPKILPLAFLVK